MKNPLPLEEQEKIKQGTGICRVLGHNMSCDMMVNVKARSIEYLCICTRCKCSYRGPDDPRTPQKALKGWQVYWMLLKAFFERKHK